LLRLHGFYKRCSITPEYPEGRQVRIQRLYCPRTGRTVSLLPDFCHPRRQHGPAVIGMFLVALFIKGQTLLGSLHTIRPQVNNHAIAQSLRDGFTNQVHALNVYVASINPGKIKVPARIVPQHHPEARLVLGLGGKSRNLGKHFIYHARCMHALSGQSLLARVRRKSAV